MNHRLSKEIVINLLRVNMKFRRCQWRRITVDWKFIAMGHDWVRDLQEKTRFYLTINLEIEHKRLRRNLPACCSSQDKIELCCCRSRLGLTHGAVCWIAVELPFLKYMGRRLKWIFTWCDAEKLEFMNFKVFFLWKLLHDTWLTVYSANCCR
jgi:hypothetical protein